MASGTTPRAVAEAIGPGLARAALAAKVDGTVRDLDRPLDGDTRLAILTERDPEALDVLRHSAAHVLATAVRDVFPGAGIGFGPPIEDGFYYDFEVPRPFTPDDLAQIEAKMGEVAKADYPFVREVVGRAEANRRFADDPLKLERISELGDDETITVYTDGPFTDLCRGPHVPDTGRLKHFKLLHAAGAYWRGDEKRQMLQRIYGTAWFKKEDLEAYLHRLEEARKRDHRRLGKELDLFMFHPFAPGAPFYTDRGTTVVRVINEYIREVNRRAGYQEIKTPLLFNKGLWEISGHWGKYRENMFLVLDSETGEHDFSLKPMNCPSHHLYFGTRKHSYRELPVGYATFDVLHRNEVSGALGGLTRVRQFQQDDCHIYLTPAPGAGRSPQDHRHDPRGATTPSASPPRSSSRRGRSSGSAATSCGTRRRPTCAAALEATGRPYELKPGDGAFYGPKIDFDVSDSIGRKWQLGTIQLDYNAPERFDLTYVGEDNAEHRPVVIHRAMAGSFERFMAILIEHFAGAFPVWIAPEQVRVIPISDAQTAAARKVAERLEAAGLRVHVDDRSETLNYRIREGEVWKVPYMAVIGQREAESDSLALRVRGAGKKQEVMPVDAFLERVTEEVRTRALAP